MSRCPLCFSMPAGRSSPIHSEALPEVMWAAACWQSDMLPGCVHALVTAHCTKSGTTLIHIQHYNATNKNAKHSGCNLGMSFQQCMHHYLVHCLSHIASRYLQVLPKDKTSSKTARGNVRKLSSDSRTTQSCGLRNRGKISDSLIASTKIHSE